MSNINPQNIDGTFPIAGQDNNSQGFRDNFTNTINNFTFAAAELRDLQTYAVLKGTLGSVGQTGTPTNDMNYAFLTSAQLVESVETINQIGNISVGGSQTLDWTDGHFQTISVTGSATLSFASTWPPTNHWTKLRLRVLSYVNSTLTFPLTVTENISNIKGFVSGTIVNLSAGVHEFEFTTYDNGSTVAIHSPMANYGPVVEQFKPSGNTVTAFSANVGTDKLLITPTVATYAGAVVTLPNTIANGTTVSIGANVGIAALRVLGSWNSTVSPSANITTTLATGGQTSVDFTYVSTDNIWYRTR
jgi:hypothetical protein